ATEADIPRILELYLQLALDPPDGSPDTDPESSRQTLAEMAALPGYHLLVAEEDGKVLGTIVLVILPGLAHNISRWAVVEYIVVDESHRNRGIGQAMMDRAAEMAQEAGCYKIMLCSNKKRPDAHRFYQRIGYEQTHEAFHRYFK
ncbi:MAG: GNAT family N-acetyltransferase, partial [Dehalococcoidales bacterium]|nr:GNAT family N-acetyltransferase [Dehalococcoidales bacterium]